MVSQRQRRRRSRLSLIGALIGGGLLPACERGAEIENAPDTGRVPTVEAPRPDGGVPLVEGAPLDNAQGLRCDERPVQPECRGANDFGCDFDGWVQALAETCQRQTD